MASENTNKKSSVLKQIRAWSESKREMFLWVMVVLVGLLAFLFWLLRAKQRAAIFKGHNAFRERAQEAGVLQDSFQETGDSLQELRRTWNMLGEIEL